MTPRLATVDERRFIASSWVQSYDSSDWARFCTPSSTWPRSSSEYRQGHNRLVDVLFDRSALRVVERDGLIGGWACVEGADVVHYVYVRQLYRGEGIARALLGDMLTRPCVYSHRSRNLLPGKVPAGWRFDPYVAFLGRSE